MPNRSRQSVARLGAAALLAGSTLVWVTGAEAVTCTGAGEPVVHDVPVPEHLVVPTNKVTVLLPEGYCDDLAAEFPVVLLLHGAGDGYETWVANTDVEDFAPALDAVVVMPDGGGKHSEAGWYSDWRDGSRHWESFHIDVLVPWVDATFRTQGDGHRAVMGLSMGGFGAMSYAARHPGLFQAAASFSGAVDTRYLAPVSGAGFAVAHPYFGTPDERVWGVQHEPGNAWADHNPTDRAADLDGTALWITTGTGTPGGPAGDDPANPGGYFVEHVVWQMNESFQRALDQAGVPYHDLTHLGGLHDWPHWQRALHLVLPEVVDAVD